MNEKLLLGLIVLLIIGNGQTAKILAVFPSPSASHYFLANSLLRALAEKGHHVTMISPFSDKNPPKNGTYRDIILTGVEEEFQRRSKEKNLFEVVNVNFLTMLPFVTKEMLKMTENTLSHPNVQELINSDEKFDVVIVEQFMNEAHKAFASHFKAPMILFCTIGASSWTDPLVGNPTPLSYAAGPMLGFPTNMTFYQRSINTFVYVIMGLLNHFYVFPQHNQLVKKYFPNGPDLTDVMYNSTILLLNSHPSFTPPLPYVPNMIDIGGFHVKPPKKLPEDLQQFLDSAKDGVIYFSLGSKLKSSHLAVEKRQAILKAFSKLKVKVLWKYDEDVLPDQPPNVRLGKWLPQQDILAHPNVVLFITHGGLLSTIETIYHGVPVLAIPVGADQKYNAEGMVNQGFGLQLSLQEITEETLTKTINELLTNPRYANNAKRRSEVFHDRIVSPMDTAIYWVEYIIRHGGAPHLRVAGLDLPWYQYFLLDVIVVNLSVGLIALYIFCQISRKLLSFCCKPRGQKMKKS